jgi:superfamily II DNA or RNA helicase
MKLYINDRAVFLKFDSAEEKSLIKDFFTYSDYGNVFAKGMFNKKKIRYVCFVKGKETSFLYSGFLQELLFFAKDNKIGITELRDERTKFDFQKENYSDSDLAGLLPKFDYVGHQVKILRSMLKTNIGIIESSTSSGKTEIMMAYIKLSKLPTLIVVNRVSLAIQTMDRLKKNGFKSVGIATGKKVIDGDIIVATIGSYKKIPNLARFKVLIIDEVHRAQAKQFQDFLEKSSYPIRFGFSATPNCGDKYLYAKVRQFMGSVICKIEAQELLENGVIALPKIQFVSCIAPPTLDWPSAVYKCIVWNGERNELIKKLVELHSLPALLLIHQIDHGKILNELIPDSVFVSGIVDPNERKEIIERFENGEINTIISTNVFNEGISINAIRVLIIAGGGKSRIETVQRLGRGLRLDPKTGKKECIVYDFNDFGNKFTESHSYQRYKIYQKVGFKVTGDLPK